MKQPDVRRLPTDESLDEVPFPAPRKADFRVHIDPAVHRGIAEHAATDTSIEICGILVGDWKQDADGPFALVTDYIRCDSASSKFAEVTFTHESWAQINHEMDTRFADSRIIGWYHSHPDFGIFLSDRDCFIQENFFSGAGQVAYVVDPVRNLEGVFAWRDGKPEPVSQYWVGDRIVPVEASEKSPHPRATSDSAMATAATTTTVPPERSPLDFWLLLMGLCLFLLGYLWASTKSHWEQERIIQGTVAHYGIAKLMRLGFEPQLRQTREQLALIDAEVQSLLSVDPSQLNEEQQQVHVQRKVRVGQALVQAQQALRRVEETFGYSETERAALASYIAARQAELTGQLKSQENSDKSTEGREPQAATNRPAKGKATTADPPKSKAGNRTSKPGETGSSRPATGTDNEDVGPPRAPNRISPADSQPAADDN